MPRRDTKTAPTWSMWERLLWALLFAVAIGSVLLAAGLYGGLADNPSPHLVLYLVIGATLLALAGGVAALVAWRGSTAGRRWTGLIALCVIGVVVLLLLRPPTT